MKKLTLSLAGVLYGLISFSTLPVSADDPGLRNKQVDYPGFVKLSNNLEKVRKERLVTVEQFLEMAEDPDTVILDTRSKAAFDRVHIRGAVHLNFSDFTDEKLQQVIPDVNTRILIYCNNNFVGPKPELRVAALASKSPALALNIPTFINLHGYGYENVYELGELVRLDETRIPLEGTAAK